MGIKMKRITVITGHFGSGKTEFSVNLAMRLKKEYEKVALLDLDIANPYFRSRERQRMLEEAGIHVYYNTFGYDITEDLPAISAVLRAPLEDPECITVVDVGGNDSGSRVLKQFRKYFSTEDSQLLCVLNANRPETDSSEGMIEHIRSIENETGLKVAGLINNTHLLMETTPQDVVDGYEICSEVSYITGIPLVWNVCWSEHLGHIRRIEKGALYPINLYMRPVWLDL